MKESSRGRDREGEGRVGEGREEGCKAFWAPSGRCRNCYSLTAVDNLLSLATRLSALLCVVRGNLGFLFILEEWCGFTMCETISPPCVCCRALWRSSWPRRAPTAWLWVASTSRSACGNGRASTAASSPTSCAGWGRRATGAASASLWTRGCQVCEGCGSVSWGEGRRQFFGGRGGQVGGVQAGGVARLEP